MKSQLSVAREKTHPLGSQWPGLAYEREIDLVWSDMPSVADQQQRTWAFRQVGILTCGRILSECKVHRPSDQMVVIFKFLQHDREFAGDCQSPMHWAEIGLQAAAKEWFRNGTLASLKEVLSLSQQPIEWEPSHEFGNLLTTRYGEPAFLSAVKKLRRTGLALDWATLIDLRDDFTANYLPKAVHSFDPQKGNDREVNWLSRLFYRHALRAAHTDFARRKQLLLFTPTISPALTPEDLLLAHERDKLTSQMLVALDSLPETYRVAIRMYFGFEEREATLAEIGKAIGVTRFKARSLIVLGLARLTFATGLSDRLSERHLEFARKLFDEGMPPSQAAREMNANASELAADLTSLFAAALRQRTTSQANLQGDYKLVDDITSKEFPRHIYERREERINAFLLQLDGPPNLSVGDNGELIVMLGHDEFFDLLEIREHATDETIFQILEAGRNLDWLLSGPSIKIDEARAPGFFAEVQKVGESRWGIACELLVACKRRGAATPATPDEQEITTRRIGLVLIAIAQALDRELPVADLLAGGAKLMFLRRSPENLDGRSSLSNADQRDVSDAQKSPVTDSFLFYWSSRPNKHFDLYEMIEHEAQVSGGLNQEIGHALAAEVTERMLNGEIIPEGFRLESFEKGLATYSRPVIEIDLNDD